MGGKRQEEALRASFPWRVPRPGFCAACLEMSCVAEHLAVPLRELGANVAAQRGVFPSHPGPLPFTAPHTPASLGLHSQGKVST